MFARAYPPLSFCFTGLGWLVLASILGLAILIGLIRGTPLPSWVRMLHVHAVLVGGVAQIMLGGFLLFISPPHAADRKETDSHPLTFWALNSGLVGMLVGFWLHQSLIVGVAGFVVIAAFSSVIYTVWIRASRAWKFSIKESWYYALSLFCLVGGSAFGEIMALGFVPQSYGYMRLAHIHLAVLGFVVLAIIGMMHYLLPIIWSRPFLSLKLAQTAIVLMPLGVAVLIGGFLNSSVSVEMAAGAMLFTGGILWTGNLLGTWRASTHSGSAASDHLLVSTFFLLFTIILGVLVGANHLSSPPRLPYGTLHLVAYTHMTFVGFIVNAIMGACSYFIPITLAADRVPNTKKRGPYLHQLNGIMNRWRSVQIATLSLGTMGLGLLAALTWNVPLTSIYIHIATWMSLGLLITGLVLFSVKLTSIIAKKPDTLRTAQTSTDELKLTA
ncbi:MAG: cbb3-type cytochrome c oxidase subunit I [Nitrospira sp.]|nr:MAG: cbb3-type cytochrome c oxidase subunit I [Nitrospira sp.]